MHGFLITTAIAPLALLVLSAGAQSGSGLMGPLAEDGGQAAMSIEGVVPNEPHDRVQVAAPTRPPSDSIPLGTPRLSELLPTLESAEADSESRQPLGGSETDSEALATSAIRTIGALTIVIGLIVIFALLYKRFAGGRSGLLGRGGSRGPSGLCEVLARYPLPPRHALIVLRFGQRVLLLSHSVKGGEMTALCELEDPGEIAGVLEIVRQSTGESINARFRDAIADADRQFESALVGRSRAAYEQPLAQETRFHHAAVSPDGDRAEILGYGQDDRAATRAPSPLRRRLESMRGSGIA